MHARTLNGSLIVMDKVTRQCPQTTTFLKRRESRSGIEPRPFCLTAGPDWLTLGTWTYRCICRAKHWSVSSEPRRREVELGCRSRVDCFVAELFLNSCFPDTAVQTAVSGVYALLGTGGVPTSSTPLFWRWLTVSSVFAGRNAGTSYSWVPDLPLSPSLISLMASADKAMKDERRRVYDVCHLRHEQEWRLKILPLSEWSEQGLVGGGGVRFVTERPQGTI